jgi:stage V sporulation protein G
MEITEVRIKLMEGGEDRLRGFCSITFDNCFVVRDLKIIQGNNGPFVAMPSRKLTSNCPKCRTKNHLRANFCNQCGEELKNVQLAYDPTGRAKLYADIAHPVNARCREMIQNRIIEELNRELELSAQPGYRSRYDDDYDEDFDLRDYSDSSKSKTGSESGSRSRDRAVSNAKENSVSDRGFDRNDAPGKTSGPHVPPEEESNSTSPPAGEEFGKDAF